MAQSSSATKKGGMLKRLRCRLQKKNIPEEQAPPEVPQETSPAAPPPAEVRSVETTITTPPLESPKPPEAAPIVVSTGSTTVTSSSKQPHHRAKRGARVSQQTNICPARGHGQFVHIDEATAQDLGRIANTAQTRVLTRVPPGYRLEATGVRVDWGPHNKSDRSGLQYRGVLGIRLHSESTTTLANKTTLSKRSKPDWSSLHVPWNDDSDAALVLQLQSRPEQGQEQAWKSVFAAGAVEIQPLTAFHIQDQDIVWHAVPIPDTGTTVWFHLSLLRTTSNIKQEQEGHVVVAAKKRRLNTVKFQPKRRDEDQVALDKAILDGLLNAETGEPKDIMSLPDKCFMKDIWNKTLGWIDLTGEFIVDGLFMRCPELLVILGPAASDLIFDMLIGLIDRAVRKLNPETEVIARESYSNVPLQSAKPEDFPYTTLEEGFVQFAHLGVRPIHWQEARSLFVLSMQKANPYLEEADAEVLEMGQDSCAYKFWNAHIMVPACQAILEMDDIFESQENRDLLSKTFEPMRQDKKRSGMAFYETLFEKRPDVLPFFGTTDMNFLSGHLFDAIDLLVETFNDFSSASPVLNQLGRIHDSLSIPVAAYPAIGEALDETFKRLSHVKYADGTPEGDKAVHIWSALISRSVLVTTRLSFNSERLLRKAIKWSEQVAHELEWDEGYLTKRKLDIETEIRSTGSYTHTEEEIIHGSRVAWRNTAKCVGRIAWNTMLVRDRRHITDLDHMFSECLEHQRLATADGSLKAVMTVFKPRQPGVRLGTRFWSQQLVRFAAYELADGTTIGDKANLDYTKECIDFGWTPPEPKTEYDVLPIVIEDTQAGVIKMFEVPKEYHKVTMFEHPKYPEFAKLGLRWCVVPTITCFTLNLGGLQYTCCPFNGWFMETEITRDLLEAGRMDKMAAIARAIGVDPTDEDDFWRERVSLETNRAVVYSFRRDGHSIVDHVTAQAQFLAHDLREKREGRECPAQWSWVVPSSGGSTMPIWHHEMRDFYIEPQYHYQAELYAMRMFSTLPESELLKSGHDDDDAFEKILILYASTTGTAEGYAYKAKKMLRPLRVDVRSVEKEDPSELWKGFKENGGPYSALLFITSTFGEGDPPANAINFFDKLGKLPVSALSGVDYGVLAIGSRVYPDFCKAGITADKLLSQSGGNRILPLRKADEINDQSGSVMQWVDTVSSYFHVEQKRALVAAGDAPAEEEEPHVTIELLDSDHPKVMEVLEKENSLTSAVGSANADTGALARYMPDNFSICKVTRNSELIDFSVPEAEKLFRSTRFLEFDLNGVSNDGAEQPLSYCTGDHACILPSNNFEVVSEMCKIFNLEPTQWVDARVQEGEAKALISRYARVGDILSFEIDLATQESDGNLPLLSQLLEIARNKSSDSKENQGDNPQKEELLKLERLVESLSEAADKKQDPSADGQLARENAKREAIARVMDNFVTIPELLHDFPITASFLTLADCIEFLPRLKPRYYSIASSSEMLPSSLQLTVGVLTVNHKTTNKKRFGVCSNFLSRSTTVEEPSEHASGAWNVTNFVRMRVNTSTFRLPPDMTSPVIMIGPGTGISPMLGFLQAREQAQSEGMELGPCMVFFGCRAEADFLHGDQMRAWEQSGVVTSLQVAFSRLPNQPKEYVQHRIQKIRPDIWDLLKSDKCHYYVCGDSKMAEDVFDELLDCAKMVGGLDHVDSIEFFQRMKEERRFQTDTWGVVEKRSEVMADHVKKTYNKAAAWLETVKKEEVEKAATEAATVDHGDA